MEPDVWVSPEGKNSCTTGELKVVEPPLCERAKKSMTIKPPEIPVSASAVAPADEMVPIGEENDHGPTTDRVSGSKLYVPVTANELLPPHGVVSLQVTTPVKFRFTTSGASALTH
jgi:hypothetical protein